MEAQWTLTCCVLGILDFGPAYVSLPTTRVCWVDAVLLDAGVVSVVIHRILSGIFIDNVLEECCRILYYFSWSRGLRVSLTSAQSKYKQ